MHEPSEKTLFTEAFERVVHALPHQPEFRALEIVSSTVRPGRNESHLVVLVDREGGVDMATVERVAARINAALDAFTDPYTLEVSSAGLNRPLTKPADYDRFTGKSVRVITTLPINNAKTHRGILGGVRGTNVIVQTTAAGKPSELPIPLAAIKMANLEYDPRADLQRAKQEKQKKNDKDDTKSNALRDPAGKGKPTQTVRERKPGGPARKAGGGRAAGGGAPVE